MEDLATYLQPSFDFGVVAEGREILHIDLPRANLAKPVEPPRALARAVERLTRAELVAVRVLSRGARSRATKSLAIWFSWLGNGWIYPILLAALVARWGVGSLRIAIPAGLVALLLHCGYPRLKRVCARRRPFQRDPRLTSLLATLDEHSFPSGHTMTLAGVLTPVVLLWPAALLSALLVGGAVAWSRIATAHHYPSDVVAGAMIGVGVGYPLTFICGSLLG